MAKIICQFGCEQSEWQLSDGSFFIPDLIFISHSMLQFWKSLKCYISSPIKALSAHINIATAHVALHLFFPNTVQKNVA